MRVRGESSRILLQRPSEAGPLSRPLIARDPQPLVESSSRHTIHASSHQPAVPQGSVQGSKSRVRRVVGAESSEGVGRHNGPDHKCGGRRVVHGHDGSGIHHPHTGPPLE